MLLRWHLEKGSQGPVDLGFEPTEAERRHMLFTNPVSGARCPVDIGSARTGVATETRESVQKMMMYALHSHLKN